MKRSRNNNTTPLNLRPPVYKVPPTFVPSRKMVTEDPHNARILEYLVNVLALTKNMTEPGHQSMKESLIHNKFTFFRPFFYEIGNVQWYAAADPRVEWQLLHLPVASFGEELANHTFCRVSTQASDQETLYITFRPFIMEDMPTMLREKGALTTAYTHYFGTPKVNHTKKTIDNLLAIFRALQTTEIKMGHLVHEGYTRLLTGESTTMTLENAFKGHSKDHLPMDSKRKARIARFASSMGMENVFDKVKLPQILHALTRLIEVYAPRRVVFSGFSLGGGSSLAAAVLVHQALMQSKARIPEFHSVSISGTMVGGEALKTYVNTHFTSAIYVATKGKTLQGETMLDPVTNMPYSPGMMHVGHQFMIDYAQHTMKLLERPIRGKAHSFAWTSLFMKQLLGAWKGGGIVEAFEKVHMIGEDMVLRITLMKLLLSHYQSPLLNHLSCEFFTATGSAAKYQICPSTCSLITKIQVSTRSQTRRVHACVRKSLKNK